jgi:hypothetical protein
LGHKDYYQAEDVERSDSTHRGMADVVPDLVFPPPPEVLV